MQAWQLGMFPGAAQDDIWRDDRDLVVCSSYAPTGTAAPEGDGYRLSGKWNFASGCDSATWAVLGARIPEPAFILVPRSDWEIEDNWRVLGLAGTGSKNLVVANAFAPRHRVLTVQEALTSAPPELPGLIAASVWMKSSYAEIPTFVLPSAEMIPSVTV